MQFDGMSLFAILLVFIIGYVVARVWPKPGQMVGLP